MTRRCILSSWSDDGPCTAVGREIVRNAPLVSHPASVSSSRHRLTRCAHCVHSRPKSVDDVSHQEEVVDSLRHVIQQKNVRLPARPVSHPAQFHSPAPTNSSVPLTRSNLLSEQSYFAQMNACKALQGVDYCCTIHCASSSTVAWALCLGHLPP